MFQSQGVKVMGILAKICLFSLQKANKCFSSLSSVLVREIILSSLVGPCRHIQKLGWGMLGVKMKLPCLPIKGEHAEKLVG